MIFYVYPWIIHCGPENRRPQVAVADPGAIEDESGTAGH